MISDTQRRAAHAITMLGRVNPFLPDRLAWEAQALGVPFDPTAVVRVSGEADPNRDGIAEVAESLAEVFRRTLAQRPATPEERNLYAGLVFMVLYNRFRPALPSGETEPQRVPIYPAYLRDFHRFFRLCGPPDPEVDTPEHLFACFYQIHRAFETIFGSIAGTSQPAVDLRAAAWQSIFSFDAGRYRRYLYKTMPDVPTLITGETGTGKELVARAIGLSGYIPFDASEARFLHAPTFLPLHLAALPTTLVEAELFGHRRGAFTGAVADRTGWLAQCPRGGTVFLDEVGELDPMLQVKILRLLEERRFSAVGDDGDQRFVGKIVAATNRDLPVAIRDGVFRQDLFYRLCGDQISVPSLRARLDVDPGELLSILRVLIGRMVPETHVDEVTHEVHGAIRAGRGTDWPWPGNVRELAQCARNVLIQGRVGPPELLPDASGDALGELARGEATLAEVTARYCRRVYARRGTYKAAAAVLGVDWRTVKAQVEAGSEE